MFHASFAQHGTGVPYSVLKARQSRFGHEPGAVAVECSQPASELTCCNPVQGSLVLHWVFCYAAQELKPKSNLSRHVPVPIAAAVIALVCLVQALPLFSPRFDLVPRLEWITYDMRMRLAANHSQFYATNLLAGVFITDQDLKDMSDGTYGYREKFPWPTHYYGMAVRELARQGAKVIGFDILFELLNPAAKVELPDGTEAESDRFFADELRHASNVVPSASAARTTLLACRSSSAKNLSDSASVPSGSSTFAAGFHSSQRVSKRSTFAHVL